MELPIFLDQLRRYPRFAIYGAQVVAYGVYVALRSLYGLAPDCFIVTRAEGNPAEIDGVAVITLDNCEFERENVLILVAVTELLQDEICAVLEKRGYRGFLRIGAREEHLLMSAYFRSIGMFPPLDSSTSGAACDLTVYEVKTHRDKPLVNPPVLQPWECPIQAGADVTDIRVAALQDNTGLNISAKNGMYFEMTATYWVWKNTDHDWKGICHYRRHLIISGAQISALADGGIDVVLPLPYICYPNTLAQFRRFVGEAVKDSMLSSLRALHPDRYDKYISILNGPYQYTYNLLAARREVFDDYCAWVFEVFEHMERSADAAPEIATTRALSYAAEALTSLYFLFNSDKLNIRHTGKAIFT